MPQTEDIEYIKKYEAYDCINDSEDDDLDVYKRQGYTIWGENQVLLSIVMLEMSFKKSSTDE